MSDLKTARPLSPHLSIYRFRPTMAMSILHRITGSALYVGTLLFGSWFGRFILFGYTWALLHHMFGGIRHLIWDTGIGLSKETSTKLAQATLVASLALTLILWVGIVVFG